MDDLAKLVTDLVQRFPNHEDFINEIEKTDKPDKEKGDYLFEIGDKLHKIPYFKLAIKVREKALEYYLKFNNKEGEAKCYNRLGAAYRNLGKFHEAIEYHNKALELYTAIADKVGVSNCYIYLGSAYGNLSNFHKTIEYNKKSLVLKKIINDKSGEAACYANLGIAYKSLGDFHKSIEYYNKALEMFNTVNWKEMVASCYNGLGIAYHNLGDFHKAIEYYNKSLEIRIAIGDRAGEALCYNNLGTFYRVLGNFQKAIEYHKKALEIRMAEGDRTGESDSYINLGSTYYSINDFRKAIEYYNKSLDIKIAIGNREGEAYCYTGLACAYNILKDFRRAIEFCNKSLEITRAIGNKAGEADNYNNLGETYDSFGDFGKGIEYFKKALEIVEEIKDVYHKKLYLSNIGKAYFNGENFKEGEIYYKQSAEIIENLRRENIPHEYKRIFWQDNIPIFDNLIISEVKLGKKEEALEYSERGKGRMVFDFILGRGIEEKFKPEPLSFKEIQELAKRIEKTLVLFRVTEKGTYSFTLNPEGKFDLLEIPEFNSKRLEELTVKLEEGKTTDGWIHAYSNYKSVTDRIKPLLLAEKVVEAGKLLKQEEENWFRTMDDTLKVLYDELIGPVFKQFNKGEKVVIIPNRALNILPLHSCFYEEPQSAKRHYLIEDYEISYAPNCNILDLCDKREKDKRRRKNDFFAVANPAPPYNLVFSEWEVEEIGKLFDTKEVYIKEEVKDKLLDKIADYGVIHLSTHGIYDLGSSFNSRLRLGKDVDLTLEEIFDKIRIDKSWLVSLSACESGLVDYRDIADEYIGLQTGFLYACAPTVIASLWTVADFTTAFIMIKTYGYIFKDGLTKAEALRKAQLWLKDLTAGEALNILEEKELELEYSFKMAAGDLMPLRISIKSEDPESKPFAHPYYWAGFQLFGA